MNNFECNYDNGDCCHATELIGNGQCDDETNTIHCNYDGGDCCLTLGASYAFVDGSCYYVEETLLNILGAKINCENILGRLFEPRDAFTNHRVMANIKENIPFNGGLIGNYINLEKQQYIQCQRPISKKRFTVHITVHE